jgi:flagellar basal-body rod protein FlgG
MIRGLYTSGTGMMLMRRQMENVTNNIVNADTTGYKKEYFISHSFDQQLLNRINDTRPGTVGDYRFGTQPDQLYVDYSTGSFEETGSKLNFAIEGEGFLVVETAAGERYTRNGALSMNAEGYLIDVNGNYVLGEAGRINLPDPACAVNTQGEITFNGEFVDRLRLVEFADTGELRKEGDSLFYTTGAEPLPAANSAILQGFLETSNVNVGQEMVDMITVYRNYETNQRILTMIDETLGLSVNQIGRLA